MSVDCDTLEACPAFQEAFSNADDNGGFADDATWVLTSSFVILTMQSGFGLFEIGCSMAGDEVNVMLKNVVDVVFGALAYYFLGYGISYGQPSIPFMGLGDFMPDGSGSDIDTGLVFSRYLFQFSFAATSTTIVSGCVAMRMRFFVYCIYSFYAVIIYSFVAHWVWADGGWLHQLGVHDFAGGGPVHLLGGTNGLIAILMVGPRKGRFDGSRPKSDFAPSSPTSMLFGLFMLWWGWIGFNCGSTFGITNDKWLVATRAGIATINSTAGGGAAALLYTQVKTGFKFVRPSDIASGILGSLVAITPSCACTHTYDALIIGVIGALVALVISDFVELKLKLDDPVGGVGVHAAAAIWGLISVGLFADSTLPGINVDDGLFRGGGMGLLGIQLLEIVAIIGWSFATVTPFFYLVGVFNSRLWSDPRSGLRMSVCDDGRSADLALHGCTDSTNQLMEQFRDSFGSRLPRIEPAQDDEEKTTPETADEQVQKVDRRELFSATRRPKTPEPETVQVCKKDGFGKLLG